jgi:short-subunit dehydrogenase
VKSPRTVLITGASSGLGAALALEYSGPGQLLFLSGRSSERLLGTAQACRALGAEVVTTIVDVGDREATQEWILSSNTARPLDLVIANAGISAGTGGLTEAVGEPEEQVRAIFRTNVDGVLNTVLPALDLMRPRGAGQIAIMSSLAGFRGLPSAPAYCASKAAVKSFGEGLRGAVARAGIEVSVVCPGYVRTPMTDANDFPVPFMIEADATARIIRRGLSHNQSRIAFPWPMVFAVWLLGALPPALTDGVLARLPSKGTGPG